MIAQLQFDYDIIECCDAKYFKLSSRQFIPCPYVEADKGKLSPRTFQDFHVKHPGDGGFFASSVENSFPELEQRVEFLNKFYQCLLFAQLPHKCRKLVVVGEKDSGKTSWARIFFGIMGPNKIAVLTKEKSFGSSMIEDDTQLLYIDEWSDDTMPADTAKTLLQGGFFAQAIKHQSARLQNNQAGVYITCNLLPNFGAEQENVERRLAIYHTKSLQEKHPEAPQWMEENAMECVVWIANLLNRNENLIPEEERFYELESHVQPKLDIGNAIPIADVEKMRQQSFTTPFELLPQFRLDLIDSSDRPRLEGMLPAIHSQTHLGNLLD